MRAGRRWVAAAASMLVAGCAVPVPSLHMSGIAEQPCSGRVLVVPPRPAGGLAFIAGSSLLNDGGTCTAAAVEAGQRWLAGGRVPGRTPLERELATRALLDLRLSVLPNGAVVAGYYPGFRYTWPRDTSWVAAALAAAGHPDQALSILRFLQRIQPAGGVWAARYHPDGSGPVTGGPPPELDSDGWVPWAVWCWAVTQRIVPGSRARAALLGLWPMVSRAADAAIRSLAQDGLPGPAVDYWEHGSDVTLATAAPLLAGLRAAADLAASIHPAEGTRWQAAATRLATTITTRFGGTGYQRTPDSWSGADAAVTFLGPPFAAADANVLRAAQAAQRELTVPNGGLRPGTIWHGAAGVAFTPATAMFALFDAGTGQRAAAGRLLSWLAAHRTALGELPEQVGPSGKPVSVAPLAWTDAIVLLALLAEDHSLPAMPG